MKTFVFGIGGTGARVLRSLTMLLASGVECKSDIVPIIIDPDMNNGDLTRTVSLMQHYKAIKEKLTFNSNTRNKFFGTEIIDKFNFKLPINNSQNMSFKQFMDYDNMNTASKALLQMLYSTNNLSSDMVVGFKGNPNIGSIVLNQFSDTPEFNDIANDFSQGDRIFIISSIFGGTGASGFPLLLNTLRTNESIPNHGLINSATIGAVTVLPYFKVTQDENSSIESDTFTSKTKAALAYYDKNIGNDIDTLYYIGDNSTSHKAYDNHEGGDEQMNKAHLIELLSALAVIDFVKGPERSGNATYKEFGLNSEDVQNVIFGNFASETNRIIRKPLTQFMFFSHYLSKVKVSISLKQQWSRTHGLDKNFFDSDFISDTRYVLNEFVVWLKEMESNKIGFTPFSWNNDALFDIVNGITPSRSFLSFFQKKDYEQFDYMLDKKHVSNSSGNKEQNFMELFFQSTYDLVQNKLNI